MTETVTDVGRTLPRDPNDAMMQAGLYHCSADMQWGDLYTAWQAMFDAVALDGGTTNSLPAEAATPTDTSAVERGIVQPSIATKPTSSRTEASASETALDVLEKNCWDLRCVNVPTGGDDYDVGWRVIEHYQAKPNERIIGYGSSPLEALQGALETERKRRHG